MSIRLIDAYKPLHPVLPAPGAREAYAFIEAHGAGVYNERMRVRNEAIRREEGEPLVYGYESVVWKLADVLWGWITWEQFAGDAQVPEWMKTERIRELAGTIRVLLILGGNRAGKTEYMAKRVVASAVKRERMEGWMLHSTNNMSVTYHQALVWKYLPSELRALRKGRNPLDPTYVSYTQQNGFSGSKFTLGNGSFVEFRNYEQDVKTFEGGRLGCPSKEPCVGYAGDELIPPWLVETLEYRLSDYAGTGLIGFTPVEGYSETVAGFRDGAKVVLEHSLPEIPDERGAPTRAPLVEVCVNPRQAVVYFPSRFNPYANFKELLAINEKKSRAEKLVRLAGYTVRAARALFPRFSDAVHVKPLSALPKELTFYHYADPAGPGRNWFMTWVGVDVWGRRHYFREWPSPALEVPGVGVLEPWALPGQDRAHKYGGRPGGGQQSLGWGLLQYKEELARLEGWEDARALVKGVREWRERNGAREVVRVRYMDSRFADTPHFNVAENTTLLEQMADIGVYFELASGKAIEEGLELINDGFSYKDGWERVEDGPQIFVYESCPNLIFALKNYTGLGGSKEATKDPIDVMRYAEMSQPAYVEGGRWPARLSGGHRGYGSGEGNGLPDWANKRLSRK